MNSKILQAVNAKIPLPDKGDFNSGEAFIMQTNIVKGLQQNFIDGAKYVDGVGFAKWLFDNYTKSPKGFVEKDADLETATYYSYEELYEKYLP